jgi:hypothetical protein
LKNPNAATEMTRELQLSEVFHDKFLDEHRCARSGTSVIRIVKSHGSGQSAAWWYFRIHVASEQAVRDGEATYAGEV